MKTKPRYGHCQVCGERVKLRQMTSNQYDWFVMLHRNCAGNGERPAELSTYWIDYSGPTDDPESIKKWREISDKYFGKPLD